MKLKLDHLHGGDHLRIAPEVYCNERLGAKKSLGWTAWDTLKGTLLLGAALAVFLACVLHRNY